MTEYSGKKYIDIHTHDCRPEETGQKVCNLIAGIDPVEYAPGNWYSLGIHPWYAGQHREKTGILEAHAGDAQIIALGESGMDKLKGPDLSIQEHLFRIHIELSEQYQKPLIIHCVKKYNELRRIRKESRSKMPWIVHGFSGHPDLADQLTSAGMYLSFGYMATFRENKAYRSLCAVPADCLFLETDSAPDLGIEEMYCYAARERGTELQTLKGIIGNNFRRIFRNESG